MSALSPTTLTSPGARQRTAITAAWWDPAHDQDIPATRALRWACPDAGLAGIVQVPCRRHVPVTLSPHELERVVTQDAARQGFSPQQVVWLAELGAEEQLAARRGWRVVRADLFTPDARAGAIITLAGEITVVTHPDCDETERAGLLAWAEEQVDVALNRPHAATGWSAWPHSWQILHRGGTR